MARWRKVKFVRPNSICAHRRIAFAQQWAKISVDGGGLISALIAGSRRLEHRKDGALRITVTKGDWKSLRARADLTLPRNSTMPAGKIVLHAGQLADLRPFLNSDIAGKLDASASLVQGKTSSQARLNIVAKDIAVQ